MLADGGFGAGQQDKYLKAIMKGFTSGLVDLVPPALALLRLILQDDPSSRWILAQVHPKGLSPPGIVSLGFDSRVFFSQRFAVPSKMPISDSGAQSSENRLIWNPLKAGLWGL